MPSHHSRSTVSANGVPVRVIFDEVAIDSSENILRLSTQNKSALDVRIIVYLLLFDIFKGCVNFKSDAKRRFKFICLPLIF